MSRPFSARVADPAWQHEVTAWLSAELVDVEIGSVEQSRIRPWSTQLRIDSSEGVLWFKANCASQSFEPQLQSVLADLAPGSFDAPVAIDAERGWMVTADRGRTWGERTTPGLDQWCELVAEAAHVQQRVTAHGSHLTAAGVPDCSPDTVLDRFDRFVAVMADLPDEHPSHVGAASAAELREHRRELEAAIRTLERSVLPVTWQHGDLHPWNVFVVDERPRLFDLGDSQWAHALETLCVPFGWITERTDLPWETVFSAYAAAWDLSATDLRADWRAVRLTQAVNRVLTWWNCLDEATAEEWAEWGDAPRHHLLRVLDR